MSANIKFSWNNKEALQEKLNITNNDIQKLGNGILSELANRLRDLIEEKAPKKSGKYAREWKVNDTKDNKITITNPDDKKFTILEFTGKRQTHIKGTTKVLHFVIDGKDIFVWFSNPGAFSAQPHVRPSLEQLGREGKDIILKVIKKKFPMFS